MITPVILCGGAGARLWPRSRPDAPKPVLPLVDGRSTLAMTLERIADPDLFAAPIVVTGASHRRVVEAEIAAAAARARLVLEPSGRDTAPAIAAAASLVGAADVILVLAADHMIRDVEGFRATVRAALPAAEAGRIVVFGVKPERPVTSYGYIQPGDGMVDLAGRQVARFTEKPDQARAERMVADGFFWNSGIFLMRADTVLEELTAFKPEVADAARAALPPDAGTLDVIDLDGEAFERSPRVSIDYAVMEQTDRAVVLEAQFDWTDLGTWPSVFAAGERDAAANTVRGDVTLVDTHRSLVTSERPKVGVIGLSDVVVVASDDSVLVTDMANAERVKELTAAIEAEPERVIGDFTRHRRPWGHYQALGLGETHQVKRLVVHPGKRLSLQKHLHRAEHWTVVEGQAEVTVDDHTLELAANESIHIPQGAFHRLANRGDTPLTVIEVQCGSYLGEDDIIRIEDDFGR